MNNYPEYNEHNLWTNVCGTVYVLPESVNSVDEVKDMFVECQAFQFVVNEKEKVEIHGNSIEIPCLYGGYDAFYKYDLIIDVFRMKDGKHAGKDMIALRTHSGYGGDLLNELLDINVIPELVKKLNLKPR